MEPSNCPMPETLERFGVNSCRIRNLHLDNSTLFDKPHNHDACKNTCDPLGDNDNGTESDTVDRSSLQHVFLATITASAPPEKKSYIVRNYITSTDSCPESVLVGASLLCFAMDPTWSKVYFLLGKERKNMLWRAGSEKWSDFGGRVHSTTATAEETAAKEFLEESLAVVRYFETDTIPRTTWTDISDSLVAKQYMFQIKLAFGSVDKPKHYVTFVKQIPWDPACVPRFESCREMLLNPAHHIRTPSWNKLVFRNPSIRHIIRAGAQTVQNGDMIINEQDLWIPGFANSKQGRRKSRSKCRKNSKLAASKVTASNIRNDPDATVCNATCDAKTAKHQKNKSSAHESVTFFGQHTQTRVNPNRHGKPCVNVDHTCCCNLLIKDDFMEKVKLGYWSIPQLQRAVESNGVFFKKDGKLEKCRSSFRSVIEVVLSELSFVLPEVVYENSYNNINQ